MVPRTTSPSRLTKIPTPGSVGAVPVVSRNSVGVGEHICGLKLCTCGLDGSVLAVLSSSGGGGKGFSGCGVTLLGLPVFETDLLREDFRELALSVGSGVVRPDLS